MKLLPDLFCGFAMQSGRITRMLALALSWTLLVASPIGPVFPAQAASNYYLMGKPFQVNPAWGKVTANFQGTGRRTVIVIQDMHCHAEVQAHIASLLHQLGREHGLRLVVAEGNAGPVNVNRLARMQEPSIQKHVANYFLQRGLITGAEYQAALEPGQFILEGAEAPALYAAEHRQMKQFFSLESFGWCEDLLALMERLKKNIYSPELAKLDAISQDFEQERMGLEAYLAFLLSQASNSGMELLGFPSLNEFARSHQLPNGRDYEILAAEAEKAEAALREKLYTTSEQRGLDAHLGHVRILQHLLTITASSQEVAQYQAHAREFALEPLLRFLESMCFRYAVQPDLPRELLQLESRLPAAAEFYAIAHQRSVAFVDNLLQQMQRSRQDLAVLVTGGFHAPEIEAQLARQGVSYLGVKPSFSRLETNSPYFSLLLGKPAGVEKFLAGRGRWLAPPSQFSRPVFGRYMDTIAEMEIRHLALLENPDLGSPNPAQSSLALENYTSRVQQLRGQCGLKPGEGGAKLRPELSNPGNRVFVFEFGDDHEHFAVLRPHLGAEPGYAAVAGPEPLDSGVDLEWITQAEYWSRQSEVLGTRQSSGLAAYGVSRMFAQAAGIYNLLAAGIGAASIAFGAPAGLRGWGAGAGWLGIRRPPRPEAAWESAGLRLAESCYEDDDLINQANRWAAELCNFCNVRQFGGDYLFKQNSLGPVWKLAQERRADGDPALYRYIRHQPIMLAMAGMVYHTAYQTALVAANKELAWDMAPAVLDDHLPRAAEQAVLGLAGDEALAMEILMGTPLARLEPRGQGLLAGLVRDAQAGKKQLIWGQEEFLPSMQLMAALFSGPQVQAAGKLARMARARLVIQAPVFNPVMGVYSSSGQLQKLYAKLAAEMKIIKAAALLLPSQVPLDEAIHKILARSAITVIQSKEQLLPFTIQAALRAGAWLQDHSAQWSVPVRQFLALPGPMRWLVLLPASRPGAIWHGLSWLVFGGLAIAGFSAALGGGAVMGLALGMIVTIAASAIGTGAFIQYQISANAAQETAQVFMQMLRAGSQLPAGDQADWWLMAAMRMLDAPAESKMNPRLIFKVLSALAQMPNMEPVIITLQVDHSDYKETVTVPRKVLENDIWVRLLTEKYNIEKDGKPIENTEREKRNIENSF